MPPAVERAHTGWRLRLMYPLAGTVPALRAVPGPLRRAARRGATRAAVAANLSRCSQTRFAAVTGSVGKTTTKDLLGAMLAAAGPTVVTRENDNGLYGVPATLLGVRPRDAFAVVEAGLEHRGEMPWLASLFAPELAVLTGLGLDHTKALGSPEAVGREKRALLERVPRTGTVVVAADDDRALAAARGVAARVIGAGRAPGADVRILRAEVRWPQDARGRLQTAQAGLVVTLSAAGEEWRIETRLLGEHLALAVALAFAAATALGVAPAAAATAAAAVPPRPGRLSLVTAGPAVVLLDEHKSRPPTAVAALATLGSVPARRRIAVLGECQDVDPADLEAHRPVAAAAAAADLVIAVGRAGPTLRALGVDAQLAERASDAAALLEGTLREGDVMLVHGASRQHLLRTALRLQGEDLGCEVSRCRLHWRCTSCPHLSEGPPERVVEAR